ncbi:MAG: response regulator [Treponema sp.]|jgi:putative two-component system response regulator|nr:response regulator [Treponema sp.]
MAEKKIILAVDDMPENLMLLGSLLEDYFDVRLAKSADMAMGLLSTVKVDLILLDIVMPEMSGFEFLNILRNRETINIKTPVIFVTSHADLDVIGKAINLGARDYIVKPIKAETLYKKIDAVIGLPEHIPNIIEAKLEKLISAAASANKVQAESLVKELLSLAKGLPHINTSMEEIAKNITEFEYEQVVNKSKILLHTLELYKTP